MTILVTGGLGFIGSHTVRELLDHGEHVVASQFGGETVASFLKPDLGGRLKVEALDITSPHAVIDLCSRNAVTSIIHLAGTPIGVLAPAEEYRINMGGLINVVEAARIVGANRISIASSIAVYMGIDGPLREDMLGGLAPRHAIEAFKKAEEILGFYLSGSGGPEVIALRLASIYGPLYRSLRHWPAQLVHAAVRATSAPLDIPNLPAFHRDDHASDLCYIADAVRGIRLVHQSDRLQHYAYNIGGGQDVSYGAFADAAASLFPRLDIRMEAGAGPHNWPRSTFDLSRARADAGYVPAYSITDALSAYAEWLKVGNPY